jgi:prefoldin subunit 5
MLKDEMYVLDKSINKMQEKIENVTAGLKELQELVGTAIRRRLIVLDLI